MDGRPVRGELLLASITNLIRGTDRKYFDLFERVGANVLATSFIPATAMVTGPGDRSLRLLGRGVRSA
jgi:hypothetical protein